MAESAAATPPPDRLVLGVGRPMGDRVAAVSDLLNKHPELGLLMVSVPLYIEEIRSWPEEQRLTVARECGQFIGCHGDDLMFRSKKGRSGEAFNKLGMGLACAAFQPGGITFAGLHFCTDHEACTAAEEAAR